MSGRVSALMCFEELSAKKSKVVVLFEMENIYLSLRNFKLRHKIVSIIYL